MTPRDKIRYSWGVLDRGAEAISSRAGCSEQLRRPERKGHLQHVPPKFSREADLREGWGARLTPAHCHPFRPDGALSRSEPTRTGHPPGLPSPIPSSDAEKSWCCSPVFTLDPGRARVVCRGAACCARTNWIGDLHRYNPMPQINESWARVAQACSLCPCFSAPCQVFR